MKSINPAKVGVSGMISLGKYILLKVEALEIKLIDDFVSEEEK